MTPACVWTPALWAVSGGWAKLAFLGAIGLCAAAPLAGLAGLKPWPFLDFPGLLWAGLILAVAGAAATAAAQLAMGDSWRVGVDPTERTDLVTGGPFRLVRNPIFTGLLIGCAGLTLMTGNSVALLGLATLIAAIQVSRSAWSKNPTYGTPTAPSTASTRREWAGSSQVWAGSAHPDQQRPNHRHTKGRQAADALVAMQQLIAQANATGTVDAQGLDRQIQFYRSAVQIGLSQTAARTGKVMKKHHALARRLHDRQDDYLRFTQDWRVPADNNGSERDIRMIKLRQKVSGCLRTLTGAQQFCAIRSYLSTAAKHGRHFFDTLVLLTEGHPWQPATP